MFHYMTANITLHHHLLNLKNVGNHHSCHHISLLFTLLFVMTHHCPYHLLCVSQPKLQTSQAELQSSKSLLFEDSSHLTLSSSHLVLEKDQLDKDEIKLLSVVEIIDAQGYVLRTQKMSIKRCMETQRG